MRGDDGDTVPVDLIEVDSPEALRPEGGPGVHADHAAPSEHPAAAAPDRRRRRVLLTVGAGVVLALAATGGVLTALDARRAEARWEALAERGWPLVDLGAPLEEGWRLADGGWPMAVTADVVVLQGWLPSALRATWRAVRADTGEVLWERADLGDGWCSQWNPEWSQILAEGGAEAGRLGWPGAGGVPDPTMLLCSDEPGFSGELPAEGARSTVDVLDLRSGRQVGSVDAPGELMSFEPVGDDSLVVTTVVADGSIQVTRGDLFGGPTAWSVRTDAVAVEGEGGYVGVWPLVREGVLLLVSPDGTVAEARDVETGARAAAVPAVPTGGTSSMVLPDGSRVDTAFAQVDLDDVNSYLVGDPIVTVVAPDGTERFTVHGELFTPWFNDGSMPDRIVVSETSEGGTRSLVAFDVVTGAELWTAPAPWSSSLLQVDGLVVSGGESLAATDLRTGEQVWEQPAAVLGVRPLTDGSRIAVPTTEDGEGFLVAFDIRTGAEQWRVPAIDGIQVLTEVAGGVLLVNESELLYLKASAED